MSRRILSMALALLLSLALCACGGGEEAAAPAPAEETAAESVPAPAETAAPAETEAPAETGTAPETVPAEEEPEARPALPDAALHTAEKPEDPEITARRELALQFLEKDAEELIRELGEPLERSYAPSCLGSGEDGELQYEGFTVYTYREGDRETVKDVS